MQKSLFLEALGIVHSHMLFWEQKAFREALVKKLNTLVIQRIRCIGFIDLYQNYLRYYGFISPTRLDIRHHEFYYKHCNLCRKHIQVICHEDRMVYFMCMSCSHKKYTVFEVC